MIYTPAFQDIASTFQLLPDWTDRYQYLVDLGQRLPRLDDAERSPRNKVAGCAAQVWLVGRAWSRDAQVVLQYRGESDARIVQGLIAVLTALYSDRSAGEIAQVDAAEALNRIGLQEHLTAQRSNGISAMIAWIQKDAATHA